MDHEPALADHLIQLISIDLSQLGFEIQHLCGHFSGKSQLLF
jgi:hypothetical protein